MPRGNPQNLKPLNQRTKEEQRKIQSMGGKASGEARRERSTVKQILLSYLDESIVNKKTGKKHTLKEASVLKLLEQIQNGSLKAIELMLKIIGEYPAEQVILQTTSDDDIREVQKMIEDVRQERGNTATS